MAFAHHDFITYYFPFREWFTGELFGGTFPLWNPFVGIGTTSQLWATIPIDIFTLLQALVGPHYDWFQALQAFLLLAATYFVCTNLGIPRVVSILGALLFFFSPWVNYFFFYFIKFNSFLVAIGLFYCYYRVFELPSRPIILGIFSLAFLSMWGTKAEYWVYQTVVFSFVPTLFWLASRQKSLRILFTAYLAYGLGLLSNLWIVNLIYQIFEVSSRRGEHTIANLWSLEMYQNIFLSVLGSPICHIVIVIGSISFFKVLGSRYSKLAFGFFCVVALVTLPFDFYYTLSLFDNPLDPFLIGSLTAMLVWLWRREYSNEVPVNVVRGCCLWLVFVVYWCRPEPGDLAENTIINSAPYLIPAIFGFALWYGCQQFWTNKIAKVAILTIIIIFLVREQGQIVLSYLFGLVWIPTRDNYLIDFLSTLVAMTGLNYLTRVYRGRLVIPVTWIVIICGVALLAQMSKDFYYSHEQMSYMPKNYPYYHGVPEIVEVLERQNIRSNTRFYIPDPPTSQTLGMGSLISLSLAQVTSFSSLAVKQYVDWNIYAKYGITPGTLTLAGYPNEYSQRTIRWLPKTYTAGKSNSEIYMTTILTRPAFEYQLLQALGVTYVGVFIKLEPETISVLPTLIEEYLLKYPFLKKVDQSSLFEFPYVTRRQPGQFHQLVFVLFELDKSLPRAFTIEMQEKAKRILSNSLITGVSQDGQYLDTGSTRYKVHEGAKIKYHELGKVSVDVTSSYSGYLVVSDIFHPFWMATVNGRPVEIEPAFHIFRGVPINKGVNHVTFSLSIPNYSTSIVCSILVFVGGILLLVFLSGWERKPDPI